ncbi:MAG TPA: SOS response-associated peptidase [Nitrospirae bacterium]|nr:SOS response-associated peptidase [Nitrospirota bacterium]
MCGRFSLTSNISSILKEFDLSDVPFELSPEYNIAPGRDIVIVINDGANRLIKCRWGFIPSWARDPSIGHKMINARAETVTEKPSFRTAFKKHRGLVVADGFYEWLKQDKKKIPQYVHLKSGRPFGFAGLYSSWNSPEGKKIFTCTIITTTANNILEPIHNRMPVIIPKDRQKLWLDPEVYDGKILQSLLKPYPDEEMEGYEVSDKVNSPSYDSPNSIIPIK